MQWSETGRTPSCVAFTFLHPILFSSSYSYLSSFHSFLSFRQCPANWILPRSGHLMKLFYSHSNALKTRKRNMEWSNGKKITIHKDHKLLYIIFYTKQFKEKNTGSDHRWRVQDTSQRLPHCWIPARKKKKTIERVGGEGEGINLQLPLSRGGKERISLTF